MKPRKKTAAAANPTTKPPRTSHACTCNITDDAYEQLECCLSLMRDRHPTMDVTTLIEVAIDRLLDDLVRRPASVPGSPRSWRARLHHA